MRRARPMVAPVPVLAALALLVLAAPAAAEEPLDDLVGYSPDHHERIREPFSNVGFYEQQGGAAASDVVEGVVAIGGERSTDLGTVPIVRGDRFTSAETARTVGTTLLERDVGRVRPVGTASDAWIHTLEEQGEPAMYLHDGIRVRGRDIFTFTMMTEEAEPPRTLVRLMEWHVRTFPGDTELDIPPAASPIARRVGWVAGIGALVALVGGLLAGGRRRSTPQGPTGPPGSSPRPAGTPGSPGAVPGADGTHSRGRLIW